jgi:penicillin-binding protein 2
MPSYLTREQFKADSIRAYEWFKMTKDSSYIDKYTYEQIDKFLLPQKQIPSPAKEKTHISAIAIIDEKNFRKKNSFAMTS